MRRLAGMGDWLSDLFGKPQSWYNRIGADEAEISSLLAEVNAFGRSTWDEIQARIAGALRDGVSVPLERFTGFDWTTSDLIAQARALVITKNSYPTDEEIRTAESRIGLYRPMVEYAKSILPELASQVQAEGDQVRGDVLRNTLRSPAEVGTETFYAELERRTSELASKTALYLGIAGAIAAVVAFGGRRR